MGSWSLVCCPSYAVAPREAAHVLIKINGERLPDQPCEAERFAIGCRALSKHRGQTRLFVRPSVARLRPDCYRLLSGREQFLENLRHFLVSLLSSLARFSKVEPLAAVSGRL